MVKVTVDLKYENYIFDLYGTLVDIHTDEDEKSLWRVLAKFYRQHGAFYFAGGIRREYQKYVKLELEESEEIQVEKVFKKLFSKRGVEASEELVLETCRFFRDTSTKHLRLYEWTIPILESLKKAGKKVYLLSNAQRSFTYHEMEKLGIVPYFDKIYISSDYGMKKPNPEFFQLLLKEESLDVSASLMLGNDQNCDILGAQQLGMDTWYVHTNCSPEYTGNVKATYEMFGERTETKPMHEFLKRTHDNENINYLKARDYFFDVARATNMWKGIVIAIPTAILVLYYVLLFLFGITNNFGNHQIINIVAMWLENNLDIVIGIVSIAAFVLSFFMDSVIAKNKDISNMLREKYDVRVFDMESNRFFYDESKTKEYLEKAKYEKDSYKYEVWYGEIFCDIKERNILCCQIDNVIYTYYVYRDFLVTQVARLGALIVLAIALMILSSSVMNPFFVFLAMFELVEGLIGEIRTSKELMESNNKLKEFILKPENFEEIKANLPKYIRDLQDVIIVNRNNGLFIPLWIRKKHLQEDSVFYEELNKVKELYLDKETTYMPESAEEIQVLSQAGKVTTTLAEVQKELFSMLLDLKDVLDENKIPYTLDGGTLIGAVRKDISGVKADENNALDFENGTFLFWDDDVDIAIPVTEVEHVKNFMSEKYQGKYACQDYYNEQFYSPRLSNLRIREKNYVVAEKDSTLWEKYKEQGLFLDIYAYGPILHSLWMDKLYRRLFIYPLNKKIKEVEDNWKYTDDSLKWEEKFLKLKQVYIRRVEWYVKYAKNDAYYNYVPFFINSLKKDGPYIKKEHLYGETKVAKFEQIDFKVPTNSKAVLIATYGEKWYQSPFSSVIDLKKKYPGKWFNKTEHRASSLKHMKYLDNRNRPSM